jgi:hypothetical protein
VRTWDAPSINVACSGNLTIERSTFDLVPRQAGNDVQLYTCALGAFLAGDDLNIRMREGHDFQWFGNYLRTPLEAAATVQLAATAFQYARLNAPLRSYAIKKIGEYEAQFPELHPRSVKRLEDLPFRLDRFHVGDAREFVGSLTKDDPVLSYPPFFANGYEKMFENLEILFDWDRPTYPVLDQAGIVTLIAEMTDRRHWLVGLPERMPELEPYLRGVASTTMHGVPIWIYASDGPTRIVVPATATESPRWPLYRESEALSGDLSIVRLRPTEFAAMRAKFLSRKIKPAAPAFAFGVLDAGRLIGCFASGSKPIAEGEARGVPVPVGPSVYLISDFSVSRSQHLAKLVAMAACSTEAHFLFEQDKGGRVRSVCTTAFSQRPSSMKYRGVMNLVNRKETAPEDVEAKGYRYMLNFWAPCPQWTLAEAYEIWTSKGQG